MKKTFYLLASVCLSTVMFSCESDDNVLDNGSSTNTGVTNKVMTATGQTLLYDKDGNEVSTLKEGDSCYGQDATYQAGAAMSYADNGDKTVTDNNTGLTWQQITSTETMTWEEAKEYCENLELGGYDDWRMPTPKELYSLSNFEEGWPYIDTDVFSLVQDELTKDEQYWSSVLYVGEATEQGQGVTPPGQGSDTGTLPPLPAGTDSIDGGTLPPPPMGEEGATSTDDSEGYAQKAFGVNYATGHIKAYIANASGPVGGKYVRAVRGDNYCVNNFVDNGDKTITDKTTGLMWAQDDASSTMDWEVALSYAESSTLAGHTDWRLPNVKELQAIVDYHYYSSSTEAESQGPAINKVFNCTPMVNEAGDDDYGYYWTSTSARFEKNGGMYYAWYVAFGRAVDGSGQDVHGAGAVRFDTKYEGGNLGEGGERYTNYVRLVRTAE